MKKPTAKHAIAFVVAVLVVISTTVAATEKPEDYDPTDGWQIPPPVTQIENPLEGDDDDLRQGERWFERECQSCHGETGQGDGPDAGELDDFPGDFTDPAFKALPDGTLFFMIKEGKDDMPAFDGDLTDQQIWQVIHYVQSLEAE